MVSPTVSSNFIKRVRFIFSYYKHDRTADILNPYLDKPFANVYDRYTATDFMDCEDLTNIIECLHAFYLSPKEDIFHESK